MPNSSSFFDHFVSSIDCASGANFGIQPENMISEVPFAVFGGVYREIRTDDYTDTS